jgi:phosphate transport system permease protein
MKGNIGALVCALTTLLVTSVLFLIVGTIFLYALPSLSLYFIVTPENATPGLGQGIANAIIGTLIISTLSTVVAAPLGIGTAIYLQRYAPKNRTTEFFRFLIEVLSGTPSVIMGIFGLLVLVYFMRSWTGGFTLISGTIALSFLIVPVIVRSVENAIESVPKDLEEASYALGARKWHTIRFITLPIALPGIMTGLILAFGRAAEESAVVILTAGYSQFIPEVAIKHNTKLALGYKVYPFQDLIGTLPYAVYHAFINSNVIPISAGFAAAFVLIVFVLLVNIIAKIIMICHKA